MFNQASDIYLLLLISNFIHISFHYSLLTMFLIIAGSLHKNRSTRLTLWRVNICVHKAKVNYQRTKSCVGSGNGCGCTDDAFVSGLIVCSLLCLLFCSKIYEAFTVISILLSLSVSHGIAAARWKQMSAPNCHFKPYLSPGLSCSFGFCGHCTL